MTWIKKQIRIILITIFGLATCYGAGTLDLKTDATLRLEKINEIPLTQQIGAKEIEFKWNDGMEGEDIIIVSDEKDYFNIGGISSTFSATNVSKETQQVNFTFDIPQGWETKRLEKFKNNEEKTIKGETIIIPDSATSTGQTIIIPDKIIQEAVWENINTVSLASGETQIFRVSFKSPSNGQFVIHALTDKGAIGKLDPWTYEQKFNNLNTAALVGQDSYSGDNYWNVTEGTPGTGTYEGAKAIVLTDAAAERNTYRAITAISAGLVYVAMRSSVTTKTVQFVLRTSGNTVSVMRFQLEWDGIMHTTVGSYGAYNADQWYVCAIEFDDTAQPDKHRTKIHNGTSWTDWSAWTATEAAYATIDGIRLYTGNTAGTVYMDTITPTDPVVSAPAEIPYGDVIYFDQ